MLGVVAKILILVTVCLPLTLYAGSAKKAIKVETPLSHLCESIGETGAAGCRNNPEIRRFGCDDIAPPPQYWGGLKPYLAMAICTKIRGTAGGPAVRQTGCAVPVKEQYIVLTRGKNRDELNLIKDREEFRAFFAPVEDAREALSYATAVTQSYPKYDFPDRYFIWSMDEEGSYTTNKIEPTDVVEKKDGFHVRLFNHHRCGCHRPELYMIEYVVSKDGNILVGEKKTIWQAHRNYQICID